MNHLDGPKNKNRRPVTCEDGREFHSLVQAAFELGVQPASVHRAIVKGTKVKGLRMRRSDGDFVLSAKAGGAGCRKVRCVENGMIFLTQTDASRVMELPRSKISEHLNGKRPDVKGYHFIKYEAEA